METTVAAMEETITLKVRETGTVKVSRADYLRAKADNSVPYFLDPWLSTMDSDVEITEPDGTTYNPYWMADETAG